MVFYEIRQPQELLENDSFLFHSQVQRILNILKYWFTYEIMIEIMIDIINRKEKCPNL